MNVDLNLELWPRQMQVIEGEGTEILFGGSSEGGKSHLGRVLLIYLCLAVEGLQCLLIRKKISDILQNHVEGPTGFRVLLAPLISQGLVKITDFEITFPKGSIISFQHCQDERQFTTAQGIEKHVLFIDEATQISERIIKFFRAWVRMPLDMKERLPPELKNKLPLILYTANPIGLSVSFFRRNFVDARAPFSIEKVHGFLRQYIPSRAEDNPSVDLEAHRSRLEGLGDEKLAKALDEGDWSALVGEFFPEWDEDRHVVTDFIPPHHWFRYRSLDWGTAEPFAVYWIAVSDGEPFRDSDNKERWFPRGALIYYQEWYGCHPANPAEGLRMRNEDIAAGIVDMSESHAKSVVTLTDSKPFQQTGGGESVVEKAFRENGCLLTKGDTSRVAGWSELRSRLIGMKLDSNSEERVPTIFFCACCKAARDYMPALSRHPSEAKKNDAADHGEATHSCDAIRYGAMAHPTPRDNVAATMESRIERGLRQSNRPTIKKILGSSKTRAYFN